MRLVEYPRQCVFAGTVNHSTYIRDETGGRRFWPITCGQIAVDMLARDRGQLWAEAKTRFDSGAVWWLETTELVPVASDQQIDRYEGDPWEEVIGPGVMPHQHLDQRSAGKMSCESTRLVDTDRQEPRRSLPSGTRVGAIQGASRLTSEMEVPQRWMTSSHSVPSVFLVCSQF